MSEKPLVLLDVDGVINALSHERVGTWPDFRKTKAFAESRDWTIWYSPTVVKWLDSLHDRADVQWLTTWEDWAPATLAEAIGLRHGKKWPVFGRRSEAVYTGKFGDHWQFWWKFEIVKAKHDETDRRIVWLEDELLERDDALDWAGVRGNVLPVQVFGRAGIRQEDMDAVDAFIEESS